jgi:hypothetical protein
MWIVLGAGLIVAAISAWIYVSKGPSVPAQVEALGPLELITHTTSYLGGFNEGRLYWGNTEHSSIRYHGIPFSFEGRGGMFGNATAHYSAFNALITFPASEPSVVVNVGDPNNSSFFYLVREGKPDPRIDFLTEVRGGVDATMLDGPHADSSAVQDIAVHRRRFNGGRFLLLGPYCVLDIETLQPHLIRANDASHPNPFAPQLEMSPDRHSFVRFGYAGDNAHVLIDSDFVTGEVRAIPIVRARMRYNGWEELNGLWVDRHFEWRPASDGHLRLAERAHFTPLPFRGGHSSSQEYNLVRVKAEMFDRVLEFLSKEFPGARQTRDATITSVEFLIDGNSVHVLLHDAQVGIWTDTESKSHIVERIGGRFDELLKTRVHDELFLPLQ